VNNDQRCSFIQPSKPSAVAANLPCSCEWALSPLRVRGIERVRLHADLTILAKLSCALSRCRSVRLAA